MWILVVSVLLWFGKGGGAIAKSEERESWKSGSFGWVHGIIQFCFVKVEERD